MTIHYMNSSEKFEKRILKLSAEIYFLEILTYSNFFLKRALLDQ